MKTNLWFKAGLSSALLMIFSQTLMGQDCDNFYLLKKGNSFEMQEFDGKNKLIGTNVVTVKDRKDAGGIAEATMLATHMDAKGKSDTPVEFKVKCDGSVFYMDLQTFAGTLEKQKDMELKIDGGFSEMPIKGLNVGDQLKDAVMKMHMIQDGNEMGVMTSTIRRKIESKESVTVPAGTFQCYKISVEIETVMEMMGMKMPGGKSLHIEYFSTGLGTVRSEVFDKSGKLIRYSVLSKFLK